MPFGPARDRQDRAPRTRRSTCATRPRPSAGQQTWCPRDQPVDRRAARPVSPTRDTFSPDGSRRESRTPSKGGAVLVAAVATPTMRPSRRGVRQLSGRAAECDRRRRPHTYRQSPLVLGPGPHLQRRLRARQEIYSTLPAAHGHATRSARTRLLRLWADEFRTRAGTSFAAPQVTAAAAVLMGAETDAPADQVVQHPGTVSTDVNAANGCKQCPLQRDSLSGLEGSMSRRRSPRSHGVTPPPDRFEPNDDAGVQSATLSARVTTVSATLDFWDDQVDVLPRLPAQEPDRATHPRRPGGSELQPPALASRHEARERSESTAHLRAARRSAPARRTGSATACTRAAGTTSRRS